LLTDWTESTEIDTPPRLRDLRRATVRPENVREVAPTVANTDHDPLLAEFRDPPVSYAWQTPYRVDIGAATNPGPNRLQIKVANLWVNRMIGDAQPGATKVTWTASPTCTANHRSGDLD
jgi:hypothetical protein